MRTVELEEETTEEATIRIGQELWSESRAADSSVFSKDYWEEQLMEWAVASPSFKVELFRLIDVLPSLASTESIARHIDEYLLRNRETLPFPLATLLRAGSNPLTEKVATSYFVKQVKLLAGRFIAGHDGESACDTIDRLRHLNTAASVDLLGEMTLSSIEADQYQQRYMALIDDLANRCGEWEPNSLLDVDARGKVPRANVSLKLSSLEPHLKPSDHSGSISRVKRRVLPILRRAVERGVFVNFDLEQWELHNITYDLFEELVLDPKFRDWPHLGIVVQAYLRESEQDLERIVRLARERQCPLTVRLVKGAYWDFEIVRAQQRSLPCPVFFAKAETDAQFEKLSTILLSNHTDTNPAFGSHNLRSIAHVLAEARQRSIPTDAYEFQFLYGMAEPERHVLSEKGHRVRVYMPIGEYLPGMAYLVRRLLENTANESFLRLSQHHAEQGEELLRAPTMDEVPVQEFTKTSIEFTNTGVIDFTCDDERLRFARSVEQWSAQFPLSVPAVIAGESVVSDTVLHRESPNNPDQIVAQVHMATPETAARAVKVALEAWPEWRDTDVEKRAEYLDRLADVLERDRYDLASLQCYEVAKPWEDADADVSEAIDFCRYYAEQARTDLRDRIQESVLGESNVLCFEGYGPAVVIAPWNFPLAILCGMSTAALVAGNTVILKPAEQSSAIGYELFKRMMEVGIPSHVVQFVPGTGESVGRFLVDHPDIAQIMFTGSETVGLEIRRSCAKVRPGQSALKRMICEMGGKNAIIVDESADLDEAVKGSVESCFGYAGQKCSACSRLIVLDEVLDAFVKRLLDATDSLTTCSACRPECQLPPVVDRVARERMLTMVRNVEGTVKTLYTGETHGGGYFIPPTIFSVDDPSHPLMQFEYFGPIVALHSVASMDEALEVACGTRFALTGGLYSRTPSHIELVKRKFRVGNLYVNRSISGAMVHRQPFGGFGMSGSGTKAGGPGYLLHLCTPRVQTENTMRHGFTPGV